MSPELKRLSGPEAISIFRKMGFEVESQRGSHAKLVRIGSSGGREVLTIPVNKELDICTLHAIIRQAERFISEQEIRIWFYTD